MNTHNFALIGLGQCFSYYLYALKKLNLKVVALADIDLNKKEVAEKNSIIFFPNLSALIKTSAIDIDTVIVTTPPKYHFEIVRKCLLGRKNVICEKPLCFTINEFKELVKTAKKTGRKIYASYHARFQPVYLIAKQEIKKRLKYNLLHKVEIVYKENVNFYHPNSSWIFNPIISGGGCLIDSGINAFSIVTELIGEIKPIEASFKYSLPNTKVETFADVYLISRTKIPIHLKMSWLDKSERRLFTFWFENGEKIIFDFVKSSIWIFKNNELLHYRKIPVITPNGKIHTSMYEEYENLIKDYLQFLNGNNFINKKAFYPLKTVFGVYNHK
jgi:predicted dehydrogenase